MVKRKDLTDIGDGNYHQRRGEYMLCQDCENSWGGTRGDYWRYLMDDIFSCSECDGVNIALVKDVTTQIVIKV